MPSYRRACYRRTVTARVDYLTPTGQLGLGLVRNPSLHGLALESIRGSAAPALIPGDELTITFVLPSGHPCKLRATVVHGDHQRCGVQVWQEPSPSLNHLYRYWTKLE